MNNNPENFPDTGNLLRVVKAYVKEVPQEVEEWRAAKDKVLELLDVLLSRYKPIGPDTDPCRGTVLEGVIEPPEKV